MKQRYPFLILLLVVFAPMIIGSVYSFRFEKPVNGLEYANGDKRLDVGTAGASVFVYQVYNDVRYVPLVMFWLGEPVWLGFVFVSGLAGCICPLNETKESIAKWDSKEQKKFYSE